MRKKFDEDTTLSELPLPITIIEAGEKAKIYQDTVKLKKRSFGVDSKNDTIGTVRQAIRSLVKAEEAGWGCK